MGMLFGGINKWKAHAGISTFVRRSKRGRDVKVKKQDKPVYSGHPPYGYKKIGLKRVTRFEIKDDEAHIVKKYSHGTRLAMVKASAIVARHNRTLE